ncbi:MAG: hypothetical protein ACOY0T_22370 [Myxococcota bacterium]
MQRGVWSWAISIVSVGACSLSTAHADPLGSAPGAPNAWQRLELEFPILKPLRFSFDTTPTPGFEPLRLPTFRSESVWWEQGSLSLLSFSQVAPLGIECSVTCQPMLERTIGAEGRLELGGLGRAVPSTHLFMRAQNTQAYPALSGTGSKPTSYSLVTAGFGGLLDF